MKKSTKKILLIILFSVIILLLLFFLFKPFKIKEYGCVLTLIISFFISVLLLGYTRNRESNEENIILATTLLTLLYQSISFVLFGFLFGFLTSSYKLGMNHLFKIVMPSLLTIITSEILRYQFIEKGRSSKLVIVLTTIFLIFIDAIINYSMYQLSTPKGIFEFATFIIFPSIMKNIFLTYSTYYYGYKPSIIYRLIMEIPVYFLPIIPNISDYIQCILNIIVPFLLLLYIISYTESMVLHPRQSKQKEVTKKEKVIYIIVTILLFMLVLFMSGLFKYYFLAVGSGSMEPNISIGDMVFVEKTKKYNKLKVGKVLVYNKENKVIVHRIAKIIKEKGKYIFKTKGDHNNSIDNWEIRENEIIGVVHFKIKYIGYPTVIFNRLFEGG